MHNRFTRLLIVVGLTVALALSGASAALASGGSGSGGGGVPSAGGGGVVKPPCTTTLSLVASATESLARNSFSATYTLGSCQSRTRISMTATDLSNGVLVYSSPDLIGSTAVWTLPYSLTSYRIIARAYSGVTGATLATATTTVDTLDALPCTTFVNETATVGYFGIYPAIWAATNAEPCGAPNAHIHVRITNLNSGRAEFDTITYGMSSLFDFEGAVVSYATPYEVDADLVSSSGAVLASSVSFVTSAPLR